jgi:hypothetical protein
VREKKNSRLPTTHKKGKKKHSSKKSKEEEHISRCRLVRSDATLKANVGLGIQQTQRTSSTELLLPKVSRMGIVSSHPIPSHLQENR